MDGFDALADFIQVVGISGICVGHYFTSNIRTLLSHMQPFKQLFELLKQVPLKIIQYTGFADVVITGGSAVIYLLMYWKDAPIKPRKNWISVIELIIGFVYFVLYEFIRFMTISEFFGNRMQCLYQKRQLNLLSSECSYKNAWTYQKFKCICITIMIFEIICFIIDLINAAWLMLLIFSF